MIRPRTAEQHDEPKADVGSGVADRQLKSYIDRILRLREEADQIAEDVRGVYAEMKSNGFDKTAAGALVTKLRKRGKDQAKFDEDNAILDLYSEAYDRASRAHTHTHAPARVREESKYPPAVPPAEAVTGASHVSEGTVTAPFHGPATSAGDDGHPGIPSDDAREAGSGSQEPHVYSQSPQAVTNSSRRKMHMSPLEAREMNGLKGFGFTVSFEDEECTERPSINDEPSPGAGPQAEAPLAGTGTGTLAGREGRAEGEAASADLPTISKPAPQLLPAAGRAGDVSPPPLASPAVNLQSEAA